MENCFFDTHCNMHDQYIYVSPVIDKIRNCKIDTAYYYLVTKNPTKLSDFTAATHGIPHINHPINPPLPSPSPPQNPYTKRKMSLNKKIDTSNLIVPFFFKKSRNSESCNTM